MVKSYTPTTLAEALALRAAGATPYAGGTDLMVAAPSDASYLFLHRIPELRGIEDRGDSIAIGAAVTYAEILESPIVPALLQQAVRQIAAPAIRNMGTVGGNVANGSPKADAALIFYVCDATLRLASSTGERLLPIRAFYLGEKTWALRDDELIVEILLPKCEGATTYYHKVGARQALAIARVSFAAVTSIENGCIISLSTAFGAIADGILGRADIDALLVGKTIEEAKASKTAFLAAYDEAIRPIEGRVSATYRKDVCMNLLRDFFQTIGL